MPINQESLLLIFMPNSAITVSQMHIPPKTHFQKAVGGVKKFFCGHLSRMKVNQTIQLTFKRFLQTVSLCWEANIYEVLTLFCFLKTTCVLGHQDSIGPSIILRSMNHP